MMDRSITVRPYDFYWRENGVDKSDTVWLESYNEAMLLRFLMLQNPEVCNLVFVERRTSNDHY